MSVNKNDTVQRGIPSFSGVDEKYYGWRVKFEAFHIMNAVNQMKMQDLLLPTTDTMVANAGDDTFDEMNRSLFASLILAMPDQEAL